MSLQRSPDFPFLFRYSRTPQVKGGTPTRANCPSSLSGRGASSGLLLGLCEDYESIHDLPEMTLTNGRSKPRPSSTTLRPSRLPGTRRHHRAARVASPNRRGSLTLVRSMESTETRGRQCHLYRAIRNFRLISLNFRSADRPRTSLLQVDWGPLRRVSRHVPRHPRPRGDGT